MIWGHVFIAASLDGFIARADDSLDWLMAQDNGGEDTGYDAFIAGMDGILMGRGTFQTVLGFGDWPYALPVAVLSRSGNGGLIPDDLRGRVTLVSGPVEAAMQALADAGWRNVYVDGGQVITACLDAGLIHRMTVTTAPILIGSGKRLFGALSRDIALTRIEVKPIGPGFVQTTYEVAKTG